MAKLIIPAELERHIDEIITHYPPDKQRAAVLWLCHLLQEHCGFLGAEQVGWIATKLGLPPINVWEVVTFYPMFHRAPLGKYHFKICRTLSCALGGSYKLHEHFCQKLGLDPHAHGAQTTKDGKFTVEFVECLAACGTAPVMMCNDAFHEGVSEVKADEILKQCS